MRTAIFTCMLLFATTLLPFAATPAAAQLVRDNFWGQDVVLAATLGFGPRSLSGPTAAYEGVMFPLYLGILSFQDENNEKRLIFAPAPGYDPQRLISYFERINRNRYIDSGSRMYPLDHREFCSILRAELEYSYIRIMDRLPIGTAKNFDFHFIEQTRFVHEDVKSAHWEILYQYGGALWESNFIMTPKE